MQFILENKWSITIVVSIIALLWYCSIKAYFSNRKDRMEGDDEEDNTPYDQEDNWIDWDKIA